MCVFQKTSDFSFAKNDAGEILSEDGRSRCPFNPEYKSTAIVAGRSEKFDVYVLCSRCVKDEKRSKSVKMMNS